MMADDDFINERVAKWVEQKDGDFGSVEEVLLAAYMRSPREGDDPEGRIVEILTEWGANEVAATLAYLDAAGYEIVRKEGQ